MSFDFNYKFWVATKKDLEDVLKRQDVLKKFVVEDREANHEIFADLFVSYTNLVNKLSYIYHHTFQVQKREIIKGLLQASSNRLLELKNELKKIELSEFTYIDRTLIQRKLLPSDISILRPIYFPYWRTAQVQNMISGPRIDIPREDLVPEDEINRPSTEKVEPPIEEPPPDDDDFMKRKSSKKSVKFRQAPPVRPVVEVVQISPRKVAFTNAITTIQRHERARKARRLLTFIRLHPNEYQPRLVYQEGRYKWTHKPDQSMLYPVKRTKFEANYYLNRKDFSKFKFYMSPARRALLASEKPMEAMLDLEFLEFEEYPSGEADDESINKLIEEDDRGDKHINAQELLLHYLNSAALKIQFAWKRYKRRRRIKAEKLRKEVVLGMVQVIFCELL